MRRGSCVLTVASGRSPTTAIDTAIATVTAIAGTAAAAPANDGICIPQNPTQCPVISLTTRRGSGQTPPGKHHHPRCLRSPSQPNLLNLLNLLSNSPSLNGTMRW